MDRTRSYLKFWGLVILSIITPLFLKGQCVSHFVPIEDRVAESAIIVEGKVIKQETFYGEKNGLIYTNNLIEIYRVFKGDIQQQTIELVTMGGVLGDEALVVHPSLQLNSGQFGIFLMKVYAGNKIDSKKEVIYRPVADAYSLIAYDPFLETAKDGPQKTFHTRSELYEKLEHVTGRKHIIKKQLALPNKSFEMAPAISSFTPTTANGGKSETITISGSGFGVLAGTVFFDDPNDGSGGDYTSTISWHIISWNDTEIVVRVPSTAGTGNILVRDNGGTLSPLSAQTLTVNYSQTNVLDGGVVYEPQLIDEGANGDGGYRFQYSTSTSNNGVDITSISAATDALERAVDSWQTDVSIPFYLGSDCGTTTEQEPNISTGSPVDDDVNMISFDSDIWDLDVESGSSTLAVLYSMYGICNSSDWEVVDMDMVIRRDGGGVTWEYGPANPSGGETDFESVVLHELGHAAQLQHTNNTGAVMAAAIATGFVSRTLGASDEIAGGSYVLTHSITYTPPIETCSGDFMSSRDAVSYSAANECSALLPVELIAFTGNRDGKHILLQWQTATEEDNDFFTLEKSADGRDYELLTKVNGAGTSIEPTAYQFLDDTPLPGNNYYRLSQTDYNGHTEFLEVVVVEYDIDKENWWLANNPVVGETINLVLQTPEKGLLKYELYQLNGGLLQAGSAPFSAGINRLNIDIFELPKGIFLLKTTLNSTQKTFRVLNI
jgi:hypothetical protein